MMWLCVLTAAAAEHKVHPIHLKSVYDYSPPTKASIAVSADGTLEEHNMRLDADKGESSFVEVTTHSLVHSTQLDKLRDHHASVRARADTQSMASIEGHMVEEHSAHARRSWDASSNGVIPLTNLRDSQYVGPIGVGTTSGTKPQSLINVVFDTGSTNLWISSSLCESDDCRSRAAFNPEKSTTYAAPEVPVHLDITFGTGELRGPQGIDYFRVGPYCVHNQTFGMIQDEVGEVFHEIPFEGILGLAFPSMSAHGVVPFFDNVMDQNVLSGHNEISFFMTRLPHQGSAVFFGGVDNRFFEGDINYFPVNQQHYWSVDLMDFKIGEESHTNFLEFKSSATMSTEHPRVSKLILDSGTTYFTAPPGLFQKVMDRLPSTHCAETQKYPNLHYILKDMDGHVHDVEIPPSVYMVSTYDDGWCDLSFMEIPVPDQYGPAFIFGEVFMRAWYTVFNRGIGIGAQPMIGFAKSKMPTAQALNQIKGQNAWSNLQLGDDEH